MKKVKNLALLGLMITSFSLIGCTKDNIGSPCKNFGKSCAKTQINSWNYK